MKHLQVPRSILLHTALAFSAMTIQSCSPTPGASPKQQPLAATPLTSSTNNTRRITASGGWLDDRRVEAVLSNQYFTLGNIQTRSNYAYRMREIQQRADIQLEQADAASLRLVRSRVPSAFPAGKFPPAKLPDFIPGGSGTIGLSVVLMPEGWDLDFVRLTDKALREAGVQRRVFQTFGPVRLFQIDSAEDRLNR